MKKLKFVLLISLMALVMGLVGCAGDDGAPGTPADMTAVTTLQAEVATLQADLATANAALADAADAATVAALQTEIATLTSDLATAQADLVAAQAEIDAASPAAAVTPESCVLCHATAGDQHQAVYDDGYNYTIDLAITDVTSVANATDAALFDTTVTFTLEQNGQPYVDVNGLLSMDRWYGYILKKNPAYTSEYDSVASFSQSSVTATATSGTYTVTATGLAEDVKAIDGGIWLQIAQSPIDGTEGPLHSEIATDGIAYNGMATTTSAANVAGCAKCHGEPYGKHGYRVAAAGNLPEFAPCAACHYAGRNGGHVEWQASQDEPGIWADDANYVSNGRGGFALDTTKLDSTIDYSYEAIVMNDVHISHAMEFPYPQTMANCVTCHEGKLDMILTDANMTLQTCKSCHWEQGDVKDGVYDTTGLALATIVPHAFTATTQCNLCHNDGPGKIAPAFNEIHTGFNEVIYMDETTKYSDDITVSIDSATYDATAMELEVVGSVATTTANAQDVVLQAAKWGLYAYDSDDFLASRIDATTAADGAYITNASATGLTWTVTADLSAYADDIASGKVKRAQMYFQPDYTNAAGDLVALTAPTAIIKLADTSAFEAPVAAISEAKCNACHDALATTFHSPDRSGNIEACKTCHVSTSGGSHIEMQSRSIDSYVHAIHSFQAFDRGDVNFNEPFEAKHYEEHTQNFFFPTFTTLACEACHNPGKYNPADQVTSLAVLQSGADANATTTRNISDNTPAAITGPTSNACGGCHRAMFVKADDAQGLEAFNSHVKANGYYIENPSSTDLDTVRDAIQSRFE